MLFCSGVVDTIESSNAAYWIYGLQSLQHTFIYYWQHHHAHNQLGYVNKTKHQLFTLLPLLKYEDWEK